MYLFKEKQSPYYHIIYYEIDGTRRKKTTKKKIKSEALKFLSEFEKHLIEKRKFPFIRLTKFETEYQMFVDKTRSKHYRRSVKLSFMQLKNYLGSPQLTEITSKRVENFVSDTYQRTEAGASLYYRTLKAAFNVAVRWGYISENPFLSVQLPKQKRRIPVFIGAAELDKIIECTKEKYLQDLFFLAFHTGMRLGEIVNLKWNAISLSENFIKITNTETFTTKSRRERIVPLNASLKKILEQMFPKIISISGNDYVFTRIKNIKLNEDYVSKRFKAVVRDAKLNDKIKFHSLRHSFASNLVQKGVSLLIVKELLGHSDYKTTEIYAHVQQENLFDAVQKLNSNDYNKKAAVIG